MQEISTTPNSSPQMNQFNSFTDFILAKMLDEYKMFAVDLHNTQLNVVKNYLWLSAMIGTAGGSILAWAELSMKSMNALEAIAGPMLLFGISLAVFSFLSGIKLMLGEGDGSRPNPSDTYLHYLNKSYGDDISGKPILGKYDWLSYLDKSLIELRATHTSKAKKIRNLNRYLVASVGTTAFGAVLLFLQNLYG